MNATTTAPIIVMCMCGQKNRLPSTVPSSTFVAKCGRCHKPLGIALADYYDIEDEDLEDEDDENEDDGGDYDDEDEE